MIAVPPAYPITNLLAQGRPLVMGILNITPDSFYADSRYQIQQVVEVAKAMIAEGADILDIGGESTRPNADVVDAQTEIARVLPVIEQLAELGCPISIDTSKPAVMRAAVAAGACMINDVAALTQPGALQTAADLAVPVCLMHMQGNPRTMQQAPKYQAVVTDVMRYLQARIAACREMGIQSENIIVDPGFGFGKNLSDNLQLMRDLRVFAELEQAILVGVSRKSMIGQVLSAEPQDRLYGSVALAGIAVMNGAAIIRAHDVKPTVDAVRIAYAVKEGKGNE